MNEMFNDEPADDLTTRVSLMSARVSATATVNVTLIAELAMLGIKVQPAPLVVEYHVPPPVTIKPPGVLWTGIARLVMSPTNFRNEWLPQIADMHFIIDKCRRENDKWGVWLAVIHAHFYTLPKAVWAVPGSVLVALIVHRITN